MQHQHTADWANGRQLRLPLDFVPEPARVRLRDAHPRPLVGVRSAGGGFKSFRTSPGIAWGGRYEYLQAGDCGSAVVAVVLDCDDGGAVWEALADGRLPRPSWIVWRALLDGSRRCHAVWGLAVPVHRGPSARRLPLDTLARVAEWMRAAAGADRSYAGLLTRCPFYRRSDLSTEWGREEPYTLAELAEAIPRGWRRPRVPTTSYGRNVGLFEELRRWAYQPRHWDAGFEGTAAAAEAMNALLDVPLPEREVRDIAKSVSRWVERRLGPDGWTQESFAFTRAVRGRQGGRKSGSARRRKTALRDAAIVKARAETGASTRELAERFGLSERSVERILRRAG